MSVFTIMQSLDQETGFALGDPLLLKLTTRAVSTFNAVAPQKVEMSGSALSRELTPAEERLVVLLALATHLRGEAVKAAKVAVVHSNVAGKTDLTKTPSELRALLDATQADIAKLIAEVGGRCETAIVEELGETLPQNLPTSLSFYQPGTPYRM